MSFNVRSQNLKTTPPSLPFTHSEKVGLRPSELACYRLVLKGSFEIGFSSAVFYRIHWCAVAAQSSATAAAHMQIR